MMLFVRPRAWWYNKVPLSILTCLLLVDGRPVSLPVVVALLGLVGVISCVANYGYALNELYDRDEDRRGGRANVAESAGPRRLWIIIAMSAAAALAIAAASAGTLGTGLTAGELLIPLAYSVPPLRTKNREWLGVLCDATAAHVYPALLALAIVAHQQLRALTPLLVFTAVVWALMTGLRGILSHQLQSEEHDLAAGLLTVVHRRGHGRVAALVTFVILPIEVAAFASLVVQCDATAIFGLVATVFVLYELLKFRLDAFPAMVFTRRGGHYLPFVDEGAYKVWGPLALAIDAASTDRLYLTLVPAYLALFRPRVAGEWAQIRATSELVRARVGQLVARVFG